MRNDSSLTLPSTKSLLNPSVSSGFSVQSGMMAEGTDMGSQLRKIALEEHFQEETVRQARDAYLKDQANEALKNKYLAILEKERSALRDRIKYYRNQKAHYERQAAQESKSWGLGSMVNYYLGTTQSEVTRYSELEEKTTANVQAINEEIDGIQAETTQIESKDLPPVYGQFPSTVRLSTYTKIVGQASGSNTGQGLTGANGNETDAFGDGNSTIAIGAPGVNSGAGITYFLRTSALSNPYSLSTVNRTVGLSIQGESKSNNFGISVAMGSFTGIGSSAIAVGANGMLNTAGIPNTGGVYIVQGSSKLQNLTSRTSITAINSTRIMGESSADEVGNTVISGDLNEDGEDDLLFSAHRRTANGAASAGVVYYILGGSRLTPPQNLFLSNTTGITRFNGFIANAQTGWTLAFGTSSAGPFVVIGMLTAQQTYVVYGPNLPSSIDLNKLPARGTTLIAPGSGIFGAVAVGDIDGDGNDDVISSYPPQNLVYVVWGPTSAGTIQLNQLNSTSSQGFYIQGLSGQSFGTRLSTGDFNKDGYADLFIGAPDASTAYVVLGGKDRRAISNITNVNKLNGTNGFTLSGVTGDYTSLISVECPMLPATVSQIY